MRNTLIPLIARKVNRDEDTLTDETTLEQLGLDSLKAITLLYELEDQLGVEIPYDAVERIETLGDVVAEFDAVKNTD